MNLLRSAVVLFAVAILSTLLAPAPARAGQGEVTFAIGALIGGDLNVLLDEDLEIALENSFNNAPLYGGRVGWIGYPLGIEGSFIYSPSGLTAHVQDGALTLDTKVYYLEANLLLIIIPGPISPYLTGGLGLHGFDFVAGSNLIGGAIDLPDVNKLGYNWGGGVRVGISKVVIRGEVRDHLTRFNEGDFIDPEIADALGISFGETLHNFEVSANIGISF